MSEYETVNDICRPRARSKHSRIVGNRIVSVGEPEPEPVILDTIHNDESGGVRLEIRVDPKIYAAFQQIAKVQGRSVAVTLRRYLNRTALFLVKKVAANGTAE